MFTHWHTTCLAYYMYDIYIYILYILYIYILYYVRYIYTHIIHIISIISTPPDTLCPDMFHDAARPWMTNHWRPWQDTQDPQATGWTGGSCHIPYIYIYVYI